MTTKPLTIDLGLDVDGSVTEAMLMKAPRGERPAARWVRLARLAIVQGCQLVTVQDAERGGWIVRVGVTSGTQKGVVYRVDLDRMACECPANKPCKHLALCLAAIGNLPDPATHGPRSAALARPMAETVAVAA